jgi:[acyl-carrier-protein] S-malonyltransferase
VVANYNSPAQHVISGEVAAVEAAGEACRGAGCKRVIPLNVSGAFHSPLMEPTVDEFRRYLESFDHFDLGIPWVANVTGSAVTDPDSVVDLLARQLSSPVQWIRSMKTFTAAADGPIYEVGPGNVLTGLMKRIVPDAAVTPVSGPDGLEAL